MRDRIIELRLKFLFLIIIKVHAFIASKINSFAFFHYLNEKNKAMKMV